MIRATNQLTEKERKDAKNIDCQLPRGRVTWFINGLCG